MSSEASSEIPILSPHPEFPIFQCYHQCLPLQGMVGQAGSKSSLGIYAERQQAYVHPFHSSVELIKTQKRQVRAQHLLLRPSP